MTEEKTPRPLPKPSDAAPSELDDTLAGLKEFTTPILTGVLAAAVVLGGFQFYRWKKISVANRSSAMLTGAQNLQQLEEVTTLYPSTPSAPIAQMALASTRFSEGQYEVAQKAYTRFMDMFPDHPLKPQAEYGLAQCLEATGYTDQALNAYTAFLDAHQNHYLTSVATMGKVRTLMQLGRLQDARTVCEDYMTANPESAWRPDFESLLASLDQSSREHATAF